MRRGDDDCACQLRALRAVMSHCSVAIINSRGGRARHWSEDLLRSWPTGGIRQVDAIAYALGRHVEFPAPDPPSHPMPVDGKVSDGPTPAGRLVRQQWALASGPLGHLIALGSPTLANEVDSGPKRLVDSRSVRSPLESDSHARVAVVERVALQAEVSLAGRDRRPEYA